MLIAALFLACLLKYSLPFEILVYFMTLRDFIIIFTYHSFNFFIEIVVFLLFRSISVENLLKIVSNIDIFLHYIILKVLYFLNLFAHFIYIYTYNLIKRSKE